MPSFSQSRPQTGTATKGLTSSIAISKGQMNANQPQPDYNNSALATQDKTLLFAANGGQTVNLKRLRTRVHGPISAGSNIEVYTIINNGTPTLIATIPVSNSANAFVNNPLTTSIPMTSSNTARLEWQVTPTNTDSNTALETQIDYEVI